jgi:hypothetical protein
MLIKTLLTLLTYVHTHHVISYKNLFTFTFLMETPSVRLITESHSLCSVYTRDMHKETDDPARTRGRWGQRN